jgi:hypothetical protein
MPVAHAASDQERDQRQPDLSLLLCPTNWLPLSHEIAERLDPLIRSCLLAPQVQEVHAAFGIESDNPSSPALGELDIVGRSQDAVVGVLARYQEGSRTET